MFKEATQSNYKISHDEYYTERRLISDVIFRVDIGSAQEVSSPKYLISAHQTQLRINDPNRNNNTAIFDNLNLRKYSVEIDGQSYPRDSVLMEIWTKRLYSTL